ncbi:MAG: rhomboid family intramembrane serine protease [Kofleriaceae bacterium]|nr:rhomboid family intramembrane serine protease [Kofleriaceae bacterium]
MKDFKVDAELQAFVDAGDQEISVDSEHDAVWTDPSLSADGELAKSLLDLGTRPVVMPIIIAINLAVFVAMLASGVSVMTPQIVELIDWGANNAGLTLSGDWWRLGTSMFLHVGIFHLAMNMIVLWDGGRIVEKMIGHWAFLAMYLTSGLVGSAVSLMWNGNVVSAGASGAVFGVFGCLLALLIRDRDRDLLPKSVRNRLAKGAVFFMGYNFLFGMGSKVIDMGAHVGGFAAGLVCGVIVELAARRERSGSRTGIVAGLGVVTILLAVTVLPKAGQRQFVDRDQMVKFGNNEVFYSDGATIEDAQAMGAALTERLYFADNQRASVVISKDGDIFVVGLVLGRAVPSDPAYLKRVRDIGGMLSDKVFEGGKVRMELLNTGLDLLQALDPVDSVSNPPLEILRDGVWAVGYRAKASVEDATALKDHLVQTQFFQPERAGEVLLSTREGNFVVGIILADPTFVENEALLSEVPDLSAAMAEVLGKPVVVQLLSTTYEVLKELPVSKALDVQAPPPRP